MIWDVDSLSLKATLKGHTDAIMHVGFGPTGQIISAGQDSTVRVWDPESGSEVMSLAGHSNWVRTAHFTPNGKFILSGGGEETIRLWSSLSPGQKMQEHWRGPLRGHRDAVYALKPAPDGSQLVSGSADSTAIIWELDHFTEVLSLKGHSNAIFSVDWSKDGTWIASGSLDKSIRLWRVKKSMTTETMLWTAVAVVVGMILGLRSGMMTINTFLKPRSLAQEGQDTTPPTEKMERHQAEGTMKQE